MDKGWACPLEALAKWSLILPPSAAEDAVLHAQLVRPYSAHFNSQKAVASQYQCLVVSLQTDICQQNSW